MTTVQTTRFAYHRLVYLIHSNYKTIDIFAESSTKLQDDPHSQVDPI